MRLSGIIKDKKQFIVSEDTRGRIADEIARLEHELATEQTACFYAENTITMLQKNLTRFTAAMPEEPTYYDPTGKETSFISTRYFVFCGDHDALRRTCAALKVKSDEDGRVIFKALEKISELKAKLEAAERDAKRYRNLRLDNACDFGDPWCVTRRKPAEMSHEPAILLGEELDAAIDAAIKEESHESEQAARLGKRSLPA